MQPFAMMIAGPNGSGKSTLTRHMMALGVEFGHYINADDIAATLTGSYDDRVRQAQLEADRQRADCLERGLNFTFETVMSHRSKLDFLKTARDRGLLVIVYFVTTSDPLVNVERVALRVLQGGHDVPTSKIIERYHRTMGMLPDVLDFADRVYLYDNSLKHSDDDEGTGLYLTVSTRRAQGQTTIRTRAPVPIWARGALSKALLSEPFLS